jgi:hypothetical protein
MKGIIMKIYIPLIALTVYGCPTIDTTTPPSPVITATPTPVATALPTAIPTATPAPVVVEKPFAGWQTYITDERRQTQQLPNQMYELLPNATKREWAFSFCPWWGNANVPSEAKNILLFANFTGFQDKDVYPDWAQERHNKTISCLETVFQARAKSKNIVLQTTQGDSTNADFSITIRKKVQEKQDAITAKYGVKPATITFGADEQAVVGMAYSLGQATPVDIVVSNPLAKQHYDGDRTAKELIEAKMHDLGMVQVKGAELKILVLTRRPGADNVDFQSNDTEQAKFDREFLSKNPIHTKTIVVDMRLYNGAWDMGSVSKRCDYLAFGGWGTAENSFGSTAAIGKILYKVNASADVKKRLILEAVAHDAIFQGYAEVQRNKEFHALLKAGGGPSPYEHWNNLPQAVADKSYIVLNNYVNKRMQEHFAGTDCMKGKTIKLTPQRPALFEAISELK